MPEFLRTVFDYELWAMRRLRDALARHPDTQALDLYTHILNAYQIWHDRIDGHPSSVDPWQRRSLEDATALLADLESRYAATLQELTEVSLGRTIEYRTTSGAPYKDTVGDILLHLSVHSAYHRGQVNQRIRQSGGEPASIDFIVYTHERRRSRRGGAARP